MGDVGGLVRAIAKEMNINMTESLAPEKSPIVTKLLNPVVDYFVEMSPKVIEKKQKKLEKMLKKQRKEEEKEHNRMRKELVKLKKLQSAAKNGNKLSSKEKALLDKFTKETADEIEAKLKSKVEQVIFNNKRHILDRQ